MCTPNSCLFKTVNISNITSSNLQKLTVKKRAGNFENQNKTSIQKKVNNTLLFVLQKLLLFTIFVFVYIIFCLQTMLSDVYKKVCLPFRLFTFCMTEKVVCLQKILIFEVTKKYKYFYLCACANWQSPLTKFRYRCDVQLADFISIKFVVGTSIRVCAIFVFVSVFPLSFNIQLRQLTTWQRKTFSCSSQILLVRLKIHSSFLPHSQFQTLPIVVYNFWQLLTVHFFHLTIFEKKQPKNNSTFDLSPRSLSWMQQFVLDSVKKPTF